MLGIKYRDGIMLAADCLASYGSLARFRNIQRVTPIGANCILGTSGDIGDLQFMLSVIGEIQNEEFCHADGIVLAPEHLHRILSGIMYSRRTEMKPLWNSHIIGGVDPATGNSFLGYVDVKGVSYKSSAIATGYGAYIALPLLRKAVEGQEMLLGEQEAKALLEKAMRVLYYRDARSLNKIQIASVTAAAGVRISEPYALETNWDIAH